VTGIHQTRLFLLACLVEVLGLHTHRSSRSHRQHILSRFTWHLLLACHLILRPDSPGFQYQRRRCARPTCRRHLTSPVHPELQSTAATLQHNQLRTRSLSTEQHSQLQVYKEAQGAPFPQGLVFAANSPSSPTGTRATSSARNSVFLTSLKVAPNHGKSQAVKSNSPQQEQIAV
jgi:hypothetical protein